MDWKQRIIKGKVKDKRIKSVKFKKSVDNVKCHNTFRPNNIKKLNRPTMDVYYIFLTKCNTRCKEKIQAVPGTSCYGTKQKKLVLQFALGYQPARSLPG